VDNWLLLYSEIRFDASQSPEFTFFSKSTAFQKARCERQRRSCGNVAAGTIVRFEKGGCEHKRRRPHHKAFIISGAFVGVCRHRRNPMLTELLAHDTAAFREFPWQQTENRHDLNEDQAMYMRRLMAIGLERATMSRVPTLDWPANLFADVRLEIAA
jgi:hypothetical protein